MVGFVLKQKVKDFGIFLVCRTFKIQEFLKFFNSENNDANIKFSRTLLLPIQVEHKNLVLR